MSADKTNYQSVIEYMDGRFNRLEDIFTKRLEKIESRTSILEQFNSNLTGKIAVLWVLVTISITVLVDYVKEKAFKL